MISPWTLHHIHTLCQQSNNRKGWIIQISWYNNWPQTHIPTQQWISLLQMSTRLFTLCKLCKLHIHHSILVSFYKCFIDSILNVQHDMPGLVHSASATVTDRIHNLHSHYSLLSSGCRYISFYSHLISTLLSVLVCSINMCVYATGKQSS